MLLGAVCTLLGILGVFGAFLGIIPFVIVGAVSDLLENGIEFFSGRQNSLVTPIVAAVAGAAFAFFTNAPIWLGVCYGLCWESAILGILGIIAFVIAMKK